MDSILICYHHFTQIVCCNFNVSSWIISTLSLNSEIAAIADILKCLQIGIKINTSGSQWHLSGEFDILQFSGQGTYTINVLRIRPV